MSKRSFRGLGSLLSVLGAIDDLARSRLKGIVGGCFVTQRKLRITVPPCRDDNVVLRVSQPEGMLCMVQARTKVGISVEDAYNIITDPNNRRVFKNVANVTSR